MPLRDITIHQRNKKNQLPGSDHLSNAVKELPAFYNVFIFSSSLPKVFFKKGAFKNFEKFTGKHQRQSLFFNKIAGLRTANLLKKRPWRSCFPVNFAKFLKTPFLRSTSGGCFCILSHTVCFSLLKVFH